MSRPVVAIITGLVRNEVLMQASFAPILELKRRGLIQRIIYVTWDRPDLDDVLAPLAGNPDIEMIREPEPVLEAAAHRKGFICQQQNLKTALAQVSDPETLIVKLRPDFVFDVAFLAGKILGFDYLCAPSTLDKKLGIPMPPSPFKRKIWSPWGDANLPFFIEDGAFMGLRCDFEQLVPDVAVEQVMKYGDEHSTWIVNFARFGNPFVPDLPIFARYVREMRLFVQDVEYRRKMLQFALQDPYFWHLLIANAWVMATSFHIDCGYPGQLRFYPRKFAATFTPQLLDEGATYPPYDSIEGWRAGQVPGGIMACVSRPFARILDDSWQTALFTRPVPLDLTPENRTAVLLNLLQYRSGVLDEAEEAFYGALKRFYEENWLKRAA